jgi:hypothetical protein
MEFAHASQFIPAILRMVVFMRFSVGPQAPWDLFGYTLEVLLRSRRYLRGRSGRKVRFGPPDMLPFQAQAHRV